MNSIKQRQFKVNGRFRKQRMTGVQRYAAEICDRLQNEITEIVPTEKQADGIRGHLWEQTSLARQSRNDVLWSPCAVGPILSSRHIVTIHDTAFFDFPDGFSRTFLMWYQTLIPQLARRAVKVLTVSEYSKSRIVELLRVPPERIDVIYNGVDPKFSEVDPTTAEDEIRTKFNATRPFALAVGSISPRKNFAGLVEAWRRISNHPDMEGVDLMIVGGTSNVFNTEQFGQIPDRVRLCGFVSDAELRWLYHNASVFVNPSYYEGFGIPIIEAFAAECPVVSSHTTAHREVGGTVAEYFSPDNTDEMGEAIRTAIIRFNDPNARQSHATLCREQAAKFTWDDAATRVLAVMKQFQN
ncbi:glycosyltransferase family 4 protein [Planctomicrobium sp. SH527]|uniref:glycosyltransferase family 4 protein n=1 Tax=Planctomicrobium sp. SH527 TaxID=3448123 RepID=UPI003F5BFD33